MGWVQLSIYSTGYEPVMRLSSCVQRSLPCVAAVGCGTRDDLPGQAVRTIAT